MTPDQIDSLVNIIVLVLSAISGGVVAKVTTRTQDRNYKQMFEDALKRVYDLGKQVDDLEKTVKEQKVQIDSQNVAALITTNDLKNLSNDRQLLRIERDEYMKSWGKLESDLTATKTGQQTDGERIKALERQVEELTNALKQANADLVSLKESYSKLSGEKIRADQTIAVLEDKLKSEAKAEPTP